MADKQIRKIDPHPDYPPEKRRYLRGNDYSPVAVAVILNRDEDKIPDEIQNLVRTGIENGAALSGTVQTPNIGFEKIICNIIANPNIRYLILAGPESEGHRTGDALKALFSNGVDDKKRIIGTEAKHPLLYNIPVEYITHFLEQTELIDLHCQAAPELIKKTIWGCFQEEPVQFAGCSLYDKGAFEKGPLSGQITDRIMEPWKLPQGKSEQEAIKRMQDLIKKLREKQK